MSGIIRGDADFDLAVPVLVVGAGACGLTAGLAAKSAGADVLVLERDVRPGGSTSMSQGYVCAAGTKAQKELGIEDSPDLFYADIMARSAGAADPVIARTVADHAGPTVDWLVDRFAIPYSVSPQWAGFFGHSVNRMHEMPTRTGVELHGSLMRAAGDIGVDVLTGARVVQVFADESGRVRGVTVQRPDGAQERIGCGALVLATCGFGANREMVRDFIPSFGNAANYRYFGHEGNEGDGIRWGAGLGAALGSMDAYQGYGALAEPQAIVSPYTMIMAGGFMVNANAERFSDEIADISGQGVNVLAQPGGVAWIVYDDRCHDRCIGIHEYDQLVGIGAVRAAPDIDALARLIGLPGERLAATVHAVQAAAAGEARCPFGRDFTRNPPLQPGYRAVRVTGALFHTQGGLKVDRDAQVIRADGSRLPNLFAGGGAAQSISGNGVSGYLPAAGICTAVTLGRLAGEAAARLAKS